jgi:Ser/Thr protein kinase RdoA (MazF antagonist)
MSLPSSESFFSLTPDVVLTAVESAGILCTGRCFALNSYENRVYDVEIEDADGRRLRRVIKFYRPGRWSREQILEEHQFIADLAENEVPAIGPVPFPDGSTLASTADGIHYTLFPRVGGRAPEEMSAEQLRRMGRLLARLHSTGLRRQAPHRIVLDHRSYGLQNLEFLEQGGWLPLEVRQGYRDVVQKICALSEPFFTRLRPQRLHGDCHLGNLLWNDQGPFFLDFDDMVNGPAVQDLWLMLPGRPGSDPVAREQLELLLEGYESLMDFDRSQIRWIEALRALRFVHYAAWIARRWKDPAFPAAFPQFNTPRYWQDQLADLRVQLEFLTETAAGPTLD